MDEETHENEANETIGELAEDGAEDDGDDDEFQGLQETLEILATELDEAAAAGHSEEELSTLEQQVDDAVEALVTLREARAQIGALRKDRGFKGRGSGGKQAGRGRGGGAKEGKCYVCGKPGHWQGDAECPGPPKGQPVGQGHSGGQGQRPMPKFPKPLKKPMVGSVGKPISYKPAESNVVDLLPAEVAFTEAAFGVRFDDLPEIHEINVVSTLSEALAASSSTPKGLDRDKINIAAVDSACNRSCAGAVWIQNVLKALKLAPNWIQSLVEMKQQVDYFRFGNGGVLQSGQRIRLPVPLLDRVVLIWICEIPCDSLGCLLGKDFLESIGAVLDFVGNRMQLKFLGDRWIPLSKMKAGHYGLNLLPADPSIWPSLTAEPWHCVGVGGVCEVQCEGKMVWKVKSKIGAAGGDLNMVVHYIPQPYLSREAFVAEDAACPDSGQSLSTAMDSHVGPDAAAEEMAFSRTAPMADSTTIFAVSPNAASDGLHCSGMESSSCGHGETSHLAEALAVSSATSVHSLHLKDAITLRSRMGLLECFMEDEAVTFGLKALKTRSRARQQAALVEETHKAVAALDGQREELARELIGPRGGLPRNKTDLVKLATLLKVDVLPKDTVADITTKVKPIVEILKNRIALKESQKSGKNLQTPSESAVHQGASQPHQPLPLQDLRGLPVGLERAENLENPDWNMLPRMETLPTMYQMDRGEDDI